MQEEQRIQFPVLRKLHTGYALRNKVLIIPKTRPIGCAEARSASHAKYALRTSAHPITFGFNKTLVPKSFLHSLYS